MLHIRLKCFQNTTWINRQSHEVLLCQNASKFEKSMHTKRKYCGEIFIPHFLPYQQNVKSLCMLTEFKSTITNTLSKASVTITSLNIVKISLICSRKSTIFSLIFHQYRRREVTALRHTYSNVTLKTVTALSPKVLAGLIALSYKIKFK